MSETVVVFPHVEGNWSEENCLLQRDLARIMIASVRETMPGVPVVMMTNQHTPPLECVDEVRRRPHEGFHWIPWLCDFCAQIDGQVLYLDTDVVVQRDLRPLFAVPADVVFTYRGPKILDNRMMPFLFGCVAYRTKEFWAEVRDRVAKMTDTKDLGWYGSQVVTFEMWMEEKNGRGKWNIKTVPCETHNYTPKEEDEVPEGKWMLHYKGRKRKAWMLAKWGHLIERQMVA